MNFSAQYLKQKWSIAIKILPILAVIIVVKFILHILGWEVLSLNTLFTSIVAATIFLLGFLITGVLTDYKESEKIPGDIAACLSSITDEANCIFKSRKCQQAERLSEHVSGLTDDFISWFYKREKTKNLMQKIRDFNEHFVELEPFTQATFMTRLKQEQNNLRRLVIRSHSIRETSFILPAYAIAEALAFFLILGMLILKMEPYWESIFFVLIVSFVVLYMIFLIKDLDNPFDYSSGEETTVEVSLKPLSDLKNSLQDEIASHKKQ